MPYHFPGHNFLGPDTLDLDRPPVDADDDIARQHDLAYASAQSADDIRSADLVAIEGFARAGLQEPHAWIGAIGLGAKYAAESVIGVQYPRMPILKKPAVRSASDQQWIDNYKKNKLGTGEGPSEDHLSDTILEENAVRALAIQKRHDKAAKEQRDKSRGNVFDRARESNQISKRIEGQAALDSLAVEATPQDTPMAEPQAGGSIPGGTGSSQAPKIVHNDTSCDNSQVFRKTFQLYSGGFQFQSKEPSTFLTNGNWHKLLNTDSNVQAITTPLMCIDPDALPWYMTAAEFSQLPTNSWVDSVKIKVTPLGYRLPFATNEADSTYANSQTLVQGCHSVGLNMIMNGLMCGYTADPSDLTVPTGLLEPTVDNVLYDNALYGYDGSIGSNMGIARHWNSYFTMLNSAPQGAQKCGPNLIDHINIWNVNDQKGVPVVNFEHSFKNGMLKFPINKNRDIMALNLALCEGQNPQGFWNYVSNGTSSGVSRGLGMYGNYDTVRADMGATYLTRIEKCMWTSRLNGQCHSAKAVPIITVGCMPVQSNAALAPASTFANAAIQWVVETEAVVKWNLSFINPIMDLLPVGSYDPVFGTNGFGFNQFIIGSTMYFAGRHKYQENEYRSAEVIKKQGDPVYMTEEDLQCEEVEIPATPPSETQLPPKKKYRSKLFQ